MVREAELLGVAHLHGPPLLCEQRLRQAAVRVQGLYGPALGVGVAGVDARLGHLASQVEPHGVLVVPCEAFQGALMATVRPEQPDEDAGDEGPRGDGCDHSRFHW